MTSSKTQPACSMPFISSSSLAMPQVRCADASSKTRPVTVDAQAIPSTKSGFFCAPRVIGSRSVNENDSAQPSRQMKHISVSKSPTTAPSKYAISSTKTHPPTVSTWPYEWIIDCYHVKTDKASGIVNDPSDFLHEQGCPDAVVDLIKRLVTVSMRTRELLATLPPLEIAEVQS